MDKPKLPDLNEDGSWDFTIADVKYRLREAKLKERSQARHAAAQDPDVDPQIGESARLMSILLLRERKDGQFEPVSYEEIMNKGETFNAQLTGLGGQYMLGLAAIAEKNANLSAPTKSESSPAEKSENSVRS